MGSVELPSHRSSRTTKTSRHVTEKLVTPDTYSTTTEAGNAVMSASKHGSEVKIETRLREHTLQNQLPISEQDGNSLHPPENAFSLQGSIYCPPITSSCSSCCSASCSSSPISSEFSTTEAAKILQALNVNLETSSARFGLMRDSSTESMCSASSNEGGGETCQQCFSPSSDADLASDLLALNNSTFNNNNNNNNNKNCEAKTILMSLGLSQYIPAFLNEGFETAEDLKSATEWDFEAMEVKAIHRARIQQTALDVCAANPRPLPPLFLPNSLHGVVWPDGTTGLDYLMANEQEWTDSAVKRRRDAVSSPLAEYVGWDLGEETNASANRPIRKKTRPNFTSQQYEPMRHWFVTHIPCVDKPSNRDKKFLEEATGLTRERVVRWISNNRIRSYLPDKEELDEYAALRKNETDPEKREMYFGIMYNRLFDKQRELRYRHDEEELIFPEL